MKRWVSAGTVAVFLSISGRPAIADDPAASFVTRLFMEACIANMGQPDKIRAWAEQRQLTQISSPEALSAFVGTGSQGSAWYVPNAIGKFALSIRDATQSCAVYARQAVASDAEVLFRKLIDEVKRPGIEVSMIDERETATPVGKAHTLAYQIRPTNGAKGFVFTLITAAKPGAAFQVSMQVASATF